MSGRNCLRDRGFTLIEVLVALAIIAIGMLGIAKMQALALSGTGVSRTRALAAIEASSLADAMHSNRVYWSTGLGTSGLVTSTVTNGTASSGNTTMSAALTLVGGTLAPASPGPAYSIYCSSATQSPCKNGAGSSMAASDIYNWAIDLKAVIPNSSATVVCNGANTPVDCNITITWIENLVSANTNEATAAATNATNGTNAAIQLPTYTLYVVP